jgi:putative nucleotidyltransferase with HDIG domain
MVQIRCDRGASIAHRMGFSAATAAAIRSLDEHWDGRGYPDGLAAEEIPLLARLLSISQTIEVHATSRSRDDAIRVVEERSGRWFDPRLVETARALAREGSLWRDLADDRARRWLIEHEPPADAPLSSPRLDDICEAFASVVDAKSPYTYRHSLGVAAAAVSVARRLSLPQTTLTMIRRAALLHDIGKLGVPSSILEKPGRLVGAEWEIVRKHPYYTYEILSRIPGFEELAQVAASHHEKLDGSGYWRGLRAPDLSLPARVLTVADIYDALAAKRPYRDPLPPWKVFEVIDRDAGGTLDAECVEALREEVLRSRVDAGDGPELPPPPPGENDSGAEATPAESIPSGSSK